MKLPKIAYKLRGLPTSYHDVTYEDTKLPQNKIEALRKKVDNAPKDTILLVSGTAAPIVNQLSNSRKVVGLSFPEYYQSKLSNEESMEIPSGSVVVIHGIGAEPANNPQFASKILTSILHSYKGIFVILETDKTLSNFQTTYGMLITNTISIPEKDVERWL